MRTRRGRGVIRLAVILFTCIPVLGADMTLAPTTPAAAAADRRASDLPPLPSEAPAPTPASTPTGDFTNAPPATGQSSPKQAASAPFDAAKSTPVEAETTSTRRIFDNPDGTRTAVVNPHPVRFRDQAGK